MMPSALRKPAMTAEEMRAENLESLKMPKRPSRTAAIIMVTGMYAMPCALARAAMGTATTAAAPEMTPGREPRRGAVTPMMTDDQMPTCQVINHR